MENTAGQGTNLASSFQEIKEIMDRSRFPDQLGVCLDTCHAFAAGYDIRTLQTYQTTIHELECQVGLSRLHFFHLNDSKQPLGSRVDRHEHIGKGHIGLEGFRLLLNDERFGQHPMVLETPKGRNLHEDKENLSVLDSLLIEPREKERQRVHISPSG
jgi:deoxyribonuclease-4